MHYSAWKEPEKRRNWGIPTQQLLTDSTRTYDECSRAIAEGLSSTPGPRSKTRVCMIAAVAALSCLPPQKK